MRFCESICLRMGVMIRSRFFFPTLFICNLQGVLAKFKVILLLFIYSPIGQWKKEKKMVSLP